MTDQESIIALRPQDVFRRPTLWRRVTRDEALFLCRRMRVVVVSRIGGPLTSAEWLSPGSTFYLSWRPQLRRALSYYVFLEDKVPIGKGGPVEGRLSPEYQAPPEEMPPPAPERPVRYEEEEAATLSENADHPAIADVLTRAAEQGVPFCEECERLRAAS
jgi:hypothetical protein